MGSLGTALRKFRGWKALLNWEEDVCLFVCFKKKNPRFESKSELPMLAAATFRGKTAIGNKSAPERLSRQLPPSFLLCSLSLWQRPAPSAELPTSPLGLDTYWACITPLVTEISWDARDDYAVWCPTWSQDVAFHVPTLSHGHPKDEGTDQGGPGLYSRSWGKCLAAHTVLQGQVLCLLISPSLEGCD